MLEVKDLNEVIDIIKDEFDLHTPFNETISIDNAIGRVLDETIVSNEDIPGFNRSTVDGYAVKSSDLFGCSESIPSILQLAGNVSMGEVSEFNLVNGQCVYIPTGGQLPKGKDSVVMLEYCEDFRDGTIGIYKSTAPGQNIIFSGDDVKKGQIVMQKGRLLTCKEIGILAAMGYSSIKVIKPPKVGVISSGDELISFNQEVKGSQIRDVNGPMISSALKSLGCDVVFMGIIPDSYELLKEVVIQGTDECDMLIITGGTSVGEKDVMPKIIRDLGKLLVHGIAIKPGKPTAIGKVNEKPVFALPGHPVAAYFMFKLLIEKSIYILKKEIMPEKLAIGYLNCAVASNHGREECIAVSYNEKEVTPILGKSGLISRLIKADGFIMIKRDSEGYDKGKEVTVHLF